MPLSLRDSCPLDDDLGGTGFSRCAEKWTIARVFAQAKACATLSRAASACGRFSIGLPRLARHPKKPAKSRLQAGVPAPQLSPVTRVSARCARDPQAATP